MKPELTLPGRNAYGTEQLKSESNVVIIGANGSGKSRMGAFIEQHGKDLVHRVSAQRALNIPDYVSLTSLELAYDELFFGNANNKSNNKPYRWGWDNGFTTTLIDDYNKALATVFAKQNKANNEFVRACKNAEENKLETPKTPFTDIDIIHKIWKEIFPHRNINIDDGKVTVLRGFSEYRGKELSDGEKVVIYMIAQCLSVKENHIIVIDEPELHLHKSLMYRVWNKIEEYCPNKLIIYITHDLDFAASRKGTYKIWVKEFDGAQGWQWEEVPEIENLPENLTIEIIGNRKDVLFTEGERGSYDTLIYQYVYEDFHIVPRTNCRKVIDSTIGVKETPSLHRINCFGIIDRDYRGEQEIDSLKKYNIYTLDVAEVENLFCIEEILIEVANLLMLTPVNDAVDKAKQFVFDELQKDLTNQVAKKTEQEVLFKLNSFTKKDHSEQGIVDGLNEVVNNIDVAHIYVSNLQLYKLILNNKNYPLALQYFNRKTISKRIGKSFGLLDGQYVDYVIRLLQSDKKEQIVNALKKYLPKLT